MRPAQLQGTLAVEINGESGGAALGAVRSYENLYYQKIWDKATGTVIYDNNMGNGNGTPASTILGGGSIVIHQ